LKNERRFSVLFLIYLPVSGIYVLQKTWGKKSAGVVLKTNLIFAHFADERKRQKAMQIVVKCKNT
jgi:hypothetical protein